MDTEPESTYLNSETHIDAYLDAADGTPARTAAILKALRSQRSDITTSELEVAAKNGTGIHLQTLDSVSLQNFFVQLDELLKLAQKIELDKLPIRLVEDYSGNKISTQAIQASLVWHRSHEFAMIPSIVGFFDRLASADWLVTKQLKPVSGCQTVYELPQEFGRLSETIFAIAYHIRQRLDAADFHIDSIPHCLRVVGGPADDLVRMKLHGTSLAECKEFVSLTTTIIKWACAQLFYEADGAMEFVRWCDLICCGYLPVGWHGTNADGTLLLYAHRDKHD